MSNRVEDLKFSEIRTTADVTIPGDMDSMKTTKLFREPVYELRHMPPGVLVTHRKSGEARWIHLAQVQFAVTKVAPVAESKASKVA